MRRRNREINIFNMSALDLFASALGAFILLFAILMPYYLKTSKIVMQENVQLKAQVQDCQTQVANLQGQVADLQGQTQDLQQQLATCEQQKQQLKAENDQLKQQQSQEQSRQQALEQENAGLKQENAGYKARLSQTFLAVVIKWPTFKVDIDLHIKDPDGKEFSYQQKSYAGSPAELSVDTQIGPGIEIWEHPSASPGEYKISYTFFENHNDTAMPTEVMGTIYFRDGSKKLNTIQLNTRGDNKQVAIITVTTEGDVSVR
jgi:uncharacterized protein YfaP (DUF2135 family)